MNPSYRNLILFLSILILASCKKDGPKFSPLASLNVADAVVGGGNVKLNTNVRDSATINSYRLFQLNASNATGIRLYPTNNPTATYYSQVHEIVNGGIYSLFLTGTAAEPESVFVKDEIPPFSQDSIVRVRVINCSPNSSAISVSLASAPATNIVNNLAYKSLTTFNSLPLRTTIPVGSNVFQVRDSNGAVLATYTLPASGTISVAASRFKCITLVIKGLVGTTSGASAFGVYAMSNY
ncbi:hypothetical protein PBAL39_20450 [Pedobacter sp. BAL39]|uniref:DUF4397 domain-containing protein n=1 Tax=Pedobacter sp. BAL39 TaxID=391596 RepID=UPI000155A183|nr:DUF4397 domain-containing protein [Pedobacter sp. BAL39]EDM38481.1 hypothetical protein PBAL39_20450 [Pedobacter sp. BAL39]